MDKDDTARLDDSFAKTRAKNNVESNILDKRIRLIDKQCRAQLSQIQCAISEERRFAHSLKKQAKTFKCVNVEDEIMRRMDNMKNAGLYARNSRTPRSMDKSVDRSDSDMSISGHKVITEQQFCQPKMYFWSQDASTKLPVMSSFYGYRLSLQRSMTEAKLLGQQTYAETHKTVREVQSAEPMIIRTSSMADMRKSKTSGVPKFCLEDDELTEPSPIRRAPPPTREHTVMSGIKTPERLFESSMSEVKNKLPTIDTPVNRNTPEIAVNTRQEEKIERLASLRTAGLATRGSLRSPARKPLKVHTRTRGEATREYQQLLSHKTHILSKSQTDLERSYEHIPPILAEVNRLKTENDIDPKYRGQPYTKSTFNMNMQNAISKRVLNKSALPVAFRKNSNTYLKHYGAPIMEIKAFRLPIAT